MPFPKDIPRTSVETVRTVFYRPYPIAELTLSKPAVLGSFRVWTFFPFSRPSKYLSLKMLELVLAVIHMKCASYITVLMKMLICQDVIG